MTAPGSPSCSSARMKAGPRRPVSCFKRPASSRSKECGSSESSPTGPWPVPGPAISGKPSTSCRLVTWSPDPAGHRPTAKPSASSAPCSRNGPMPASIPATAAASSGSPPGSASTITADLTPPWLDRLPPQCLSTRPVGTTASGSARRSLELGATAAPLLRPRRVGPCRTSGRARRRGSPGAGRRGRRSVGTGLRGAGRAPAPPAASAPECGSPPGGRGSADRPRRLAASGRPGQRGLEVLRLEDLRQRPRHDLGVKGEVPLERVHSQDHRDRAALDLVADGGAVQDLDRTPLGEVANVARPEVARGAPAQGDDGAGRKHPQDAVEVAGAALIDRLLGHPVRVLGRAAADPAVERQLQGVVLVSLLVPALPGRLEDGADEAEVGGHPFGDEVVGKVGLPLQPFGEGLAGGAARIQRARAQEEDGPGGIAEADLGPAVAAGQSVAGA